MIKACKRGRTTARSDVRPASWLSEIKKKKKKTKSQAGGRLEPLHETRQHPIMKGERQKRERVEGPAKAHGYEGKKKQFNLLGNLCP